MQSRRSLALAVAGLLAIGGIAYLSTLASGTITIEVWDAPFGWDRLTVVFSDIQVHRAGAENESGWSSLPLSTTEVDFMALGNLTRILALDRAPAGKYTQIRIVVNSVTGVMNGTSVELIVPDHELKIITPFDLPGGGSITVTLDFDLASSIHAAGDKWIFRPVLGEIVIH